MNLIILCIPRGETRGDAACSCRGEQHSALQPARLVHITAKSESLNTFIFEIYIRQNVGRCKISSLITWKVGFLFTTSEEQANCSA